MPIPTDIGPRHVLLGDPTTALGAGMLPFGLSPNVKLGGSGARQKMSRDAYGNAAGEARFYQGREIEITVKVPRSVSSDIRDYMEFTDSSGDYVARGSSLPKQTLVLIHPDDAASTTSGASAKTRWFPSVALTGVGEEEYDGETDGVDESAYVELTFTTNYVDTDQDDNDVDEAAQPDFHGDRLSTHALPWVLPTPYGPSE